MAEIQAFLDTYFTLSIYADEPDPIIRPSNRPIKRLGLCLEGFPELTQWVIAQQLDALFLHRAWGVDLTSIDTSIGVFTYHRPFDEQLTTGYNRRLADLLHLEQITLMPGKGRWPIGMIGTVPPASITQWQERLAGIFGGFEAAQNCTHAERMIKRVAVVGGMTAELVQFAVAQMVDLYLTGQLRQPAQRSVMETGIAVIALGHRRTEAWGLRVLGHLLQERWGQLEICLPPNNP